jgi:hypothetical protein
MASCKRQDKLVKLDILTTLMHHKFNKRDNLLAHATMTSNMDLTHLQDNLNSNQDSPNHVQDTQIIDSSMLEYQATNIKCF